MLRPVGLYTTRGTTDPTVDLSDGFVNALDGNVPDDYYRAQDTAAGVLTTWPRRLGSADGTSSNGPTKNSTGWGGTQPTQDFNGAVRVEFNHYAAAQAANPNAVYSGVLPIYRTAETTGYFFCFGDDTAANITHGFYLQNTGNVGIQTKQADGTIKDNVLGASAVPLSTRVILAFSYRGTSGFEVVTVHGAGIETQRLFAGSAEALTAGNFPITDCWLGRSPRTVSPVGMAARAGGMVLRRAAWDQSTLYAAAHHYATLYPTA